MTKVGVGVTLGCKVALIDVKFSLPELNDDTRVLEGWIKELEIIIILEKFSDETKELVMAKDLCVLVIVATIKVVKNVDIGIGELLFNKEVLSSWRVDEIIVTEVVTKPLVTNNEVAFSTEVVFGKRLTKLDEAEIKNVLVSGADKIEDELETLLPIDKLVWLTNVVTSTDVMAMVTELFDVMTVRVGSVFNAGNVTFGVDE